MGFLESFNRGLSGDDGYEFAGRQVACSHCGGTAFDERSAQLNTMGLTFSTSIGRTGAPRSSSARTAATSSGSCDAGAERYQIETDFLSLFDRNRDFDQIGEYNDACI